MLAGSSGIGHVRYPTAGTLSAQEAQPFFVNSPLGIYLIHNGNITNAPELRHLLQGSNSFFNRHLRTGSDSEVSCMKALQALKMCRSFAPQRLFLTALDSIAWPL